ncbi:MAG: MBL fold metallo-hydrolase [Thermoflexales bacterium]|nr:MBL fold metallo-hydrolase [Thermoflexales bacterium]
MKLTCLVDNAVLPYTPFWGEHGLSVLVDTPEGRVLFDTGASGTVLLHNLEAAEVDPASIRALALSHGHQDHTGGLAALLERRPGLPVYGHPDLLRERFSRRDAEMRAVGMPVYRSPDAREEEGMRSIGMTIPPEDLRRRADLRLSPQPQEILPGVWTTGEVTGRTEPEGRSPYHFVRGGAGWEPDPYRDDLSLVLETRRGLVLLCGCCHAGLLNTLAHVERVFGRPVVAVFGGTHLVSADADHLERVRQKLQLLSPIRVSPNHCTGETAFHFLRQALGPEVVRPFPAGAQVDLENL